MTACLLLGLIVVEGKPSECRQSVHAGRAKPHYLIQHPCMQDKAPTDGILCKYSGLFLRQP